MTLVDQELPMAFLATIARKSYTFILNPSS